MSYKQIAGVTGMSQRSVGAVAHGEREKLLRSTAITLLEALEKILDERIAALQSLREGLCEVEMELFLPMRWNTAELMAAVKARHITLHGRLNEADRLRLYRSATLTTERADSICLALGLYPEEVWHGTWCRTTGRP